MPLEESPTDDSTSDLAPKSPIGSADRARRTAVSACIAPSPATILPDKRDLIVYVPPGYDKHPDRTYPVLYMQ